MDKSTVCRALKNTAKDNIYFKTSVIQWQIISRQLALEMGLIQI